MLHAAGDGIALADMVVSGGRFASTLGVGPEQLAGRDVQATIVMAVPNPQVLGELAAAVAEGSLKVPISKTYGLDQIGQALKDFGSGSLGKISVAVR